MNSNKPSIQNVDKETAAGAALYNRFVLALYDLEVLMFEMPVVFKCSLKKVKDLYNDNITNKHLDLGVGTGYFLDKSKFPSDSPEIHLMDLNVNSLSKTSRRIKRYNPVAHQWNILDPITFELPVFDSIGASNFLHCLPGTMLEKEKVFENLNPYLNKGGVFFGTTVIGKNIEVGRLFKKMNKLYNEKAFFSNLNDDMDSLDVILSNHFSEYSLELVGSIAIFAGVKYH